MSKAAAVLKALGISADQDAHKVFWAKDFDNYKEAVEIALGESKPAPKVEAPKPAAPKKKGK